MLPWGAELPSSGRADPTARRETRCHRDQRVPPDRTGPAHRAGSSGTPRMRHLPLPGLRPSQGLAARFGPLQPASATICRTAGLAEQTSSTQPGVSRYCVTAMRARHSAPKRSPTSTRFTTSRCGRFPITEAIRSRTWEQVRGSSSPCTMTVATPRVQFTVTADDGTSGITHPLPRRQGGFDESHLSCNGVALPGGLDPHLCLIITQTPRPASPVLARFRRAARSRTRRTTATTWKSCASTSRTSRWI